MDGSEPITVMYNPEKVVMNKAVPWKKEKKTKQDLPIYQYTGGQGRSLKVDLHFDTSGADGDGPDATDVQTLIDPILELTTKGANDVKPNEPPLVDFAWGMGYGMDICGRLKTCNVTYTRFNPDGTPTRAQVQLEIIEQFDEGTKGWSDLPEPEDVRTERLDGGR